MRRRIGIIVLCLLLALTVLPAASADGDKATSDRYLELNETNFPDRAFRDYILDSQVHSGTESTGYYMTKAQVLAVTSIDLTYTDVSDFKGIEHFTELKALNCGSYDGPETVKNLNIGKLTKLVRLTVCNIEMKNPDFSKNTALQGLFLQGTKTESLDLSKNVNLTAVELGGLKAKKLDLRPLKKLQSFVVYGGELTELDVSQNTELSVLALSDTKIKTLDVSHNPKLEKIRCDEAPLSTLILGEHPLAKNVDVVYCRLTEIDLSGCPNLEELHLSGNRLTALDVSFCPKLDYLNGSGNRLESIELGGIANLYGLYLNGNCLTELQLGTQPHLDAKYVNVKKQKTVGAGFTQDGDRYAFDLSALVSDLSRVTVNDSGVSFDAETGIVTADEPKAFTYLYRTGYGQMDVTVEQPFAGKAQIEWNADEVQFRDKTAYVIHTGTPQKPGFTVKDESGKTVDPSLYTYRFTNNTNPGTATLRVTFKGTDNTCAATFKIYLPATTETSVENRQGGVRIAWAKVPGAKGYVIYRRAWSSTTNGWTAFERWNNTTETEWTDTKVYAGTRYQYGVKAYYSDPMDNYNLGMVGPLKTTVRITTRELKSVTAGAKQMTVKWTPSKNFTGYQIKYATDAGFTKNVKAVKVESATAASKLITGLKSGTTYYVVIRSYHVFEGMTYFGEWSNVLSCKVK